MGLKVFVTAGEDIGDHKLVYIASDGKCYLADASSVSTMPSMGLSCGAIGEDITGEVIIAGLISLPEWNWTRGGENGLLYVSTDAGEFTQTKPSTTGDQVQVVGIPITGTMIMFSPNYVLEEVT